VDGGGGGREMVIVGVMRVDVDSAVKLGLRNYIEFGGGDADAGRDVGSVGGGGASGGGGGTVETSRGKMLLGEEDVLLGVGGSGGGDDGVVVERGGVNGLKGSGNYQENYQGGGLIEYFIRWMFSW